MTTANDLWAQSIIAAIGALPRPKDGRRTNYALVSEARLRATRECFATEAFREATADGVLVLNVVEPVRIVESTSRTRRVFPIDPECRCQCFDACVCGSGGCLCMRGMWCGCDAMSRTAPKRGSPEWHKILRGGEWQDILSVEMLPKLLHCLPSEIHTLPPAIHTLRIEMRCTDVAYYRYGPPMMNELLRSIATTSVQHLIIVPSDGHITSPRQFTDNELWALGKFLEDATKGKLAKLTLCGSCCASCPYTQWVTYLRTHKPKGVTVVTDSSVAA